MATFVIHLYRLQEDLDKLSEQLVFHEKFLLSEGKRPINHNLQAIIKEVQDFKTNFDALINEQGAKNAIDIYQNKYIGSEYYRYAEVTYENQARIKIIRLLGSGISPARFFISNVANYFSITTLNLITDIRELVRENLSSSLSQLFKCEEESDFFHDMRAVHSAFSQEKKEQYKYKYKWEKFETYFSPKIEYASDPKMTDEEIERKVAEHQSKTYLSKIELEKKLEQVEKEKQKLIENRKQKILKSTNPSEELDKIIKDSKKKATGVGQEISEFGSELDKAKDQALQKSKDIIFDWIDRHTIGCLIEEALKCALPANIDCKDALGSLTPGEIFDRLSLVFPKGSDTFQQIERAVENMLYENTGIPKLKSDIARLKKSIEDDQRLLKSLKNASASDAKVREGIKNLEAKIPVYEAQLEQKQKEFGDALDIFVADMNLSERQANEIKNGGGNISAILSLPQEDSELGTTTITGKIIAAVDTIVPLEDLCQAIISALSGGFSGFDFKLPEPKETDDIFAGVAGKIGKMIGSLLIEAIVAFIQSMLEDLINCDNLDNFVSKMVNSSMTGEEANLLNELFGGNSAEEIVQANYEEFTNTFAASASKNIKNPLNESKSNIISEKDIKAILTPEIDFKEDITKEKVLQESALTIADLAEASTITQTQIYGQIFGTGEYIQNLFNQGKSPDGNWIIDSTGTKFEVVDGIRVIDLQEIDKFVSSLTEDTKDLIRGATKQALIDAFGQPEVQETNKEQTTNTSYKQLSLVLSKDEKQNIKNEFSCIMKHVTSLLSPSQTLSLFAGTATDEVISFATQIVSLCAPNLKNVFDTNNKVSNMLSTFGNIAGLNNMKDSVQLLTTSEQFNKLVIEPNRCGPYDSVDDFRKDLMMNIIQPAKAEKIIEEVNKEKMQKFREIGNSLIDMSNGASPAISDRNPNKLMLASIKAVLDNSNIPVSAPPKERKKTDTIEKQIEKAIEDEFKNSPVVQNMYNKMVDSLVRPIDTSFRLDMDGFIEAFSDIIEKEEVVERKKIFKIGDERYEAINPVFKELLDSNLIPAISTDFRYAKMVDKSAFESKKIAEDQLTVIKDVSSNKPGGPLYVSGDPSKNYLEKGLNGIPIPPIIKKNNKKEIGASLKRNLPNFEANVDFIGKKLQLSITGSITDTQDSLLVEAQKNLELNDIIKEIFSSIKQNKPQWTIRLEEYREDGITYSETSFSTSGSAEPFLIGKNIVHKVPSVPLRGISTLLKNKYNTENKQRKQVFDDILFENMKYFISDMQDPYIQDRFSRGNERQYSDLIDNFLNASVKSILNIKLLETNEEIKNKTGQNITNIETLNFASRCKTILDFKKLKKEFIEIHESLEQPKISLRQRKGLEPRPSRTMEAGLLIVSKIFIRLCCFEILLKSLPSFDRYKFSSGLIENEMMIDFVCNYIETQINKNNLGNTIFSNIKKYYEKRLEMQDEQYMEISDAEKQQHALKNSSYPIEMKKIVEQEFKQLLEKTKELVNIKDETEVDEVDDFIEPILEEFKVVTVHSENIKPKRNFFIEKEIDREFVLQRYIRIPGINRNSKVVRENPEYFTNQKIESLKKSKVIDFDQAATFFSDIMYGIGSEYEVFDCEDEHSNNGEGASNALFSEPYKVGLRILYVEKKDKVSNVYEIGDSSYPFVMDNCEKERIGRIVEQNSLNNNLIQYNIVNIAAEEISVNQTETASAFIRRNNENRYEQEFFLKLKKKLLKNKDLNLFFGYSIPLKEIASMFIIHTCFANNNYKMSNLLEPTKKVVTNTVNTLATMGDRTKNSLDDMMTNILDSMANTGNPAGPLDLDAFKMYARTPIQILKSLATILDPNIALADKINSGISIAGSVVGQKIFIPYSALSLALLPAPIFGGLIPYVPPLTAYNLAPPLGPAFLLLEPLLWDLPWFQGVAKPEQDGVQDGDCEDEE